MQTIEWIESKIAELWDEFFRVQSVPHIDNEGYLEKKRILKTIREKIHRYSFDLNILRHAKSHR